MPEEEPIHIINVALKTQLESDEVLISKLNEFVSKKVNNLYCMCSVYVMKSVYFIIFNGRVTLSSFCSMIKLHFTDFSALNNHLMSYSTVFLKTSISLEFISKKTQQEYIYTLVLLSNGTKCILKIILLACGFKFMCLLNDF